MFPVCELSDQAACLPQWKASICKAFELTGGKRTWPVSLTNQRSKQIAETTPSSVDRDRFSLLKWWVQVSGDPSSQCPFSR